MIVYHVTIIYYLDNKILLAPPSLVKEHANKILLAPIMLLRTIFLEYIHQLPLSLQEHK